MLVQNGGAERRCSTIWWTDLCIYKGEPSKVGASKPQNLPSTGSSHKAIGKHADRSTAQVHRELQQQVVKAKFLRSLSSSTKSGIIRCWSRWATREVFCFQRREEVEMNGNLRARTGTSTTEKNHFGSSCCFYGWILVQNQTNRTFLFCFRKVKNCYRNGQKLIKEGKQAVHWLEKITRIRRQGPEPADKKNQFKRVKKENTFKCPQNQQSLSFWSVVLPIKLWAMRHLVK